MVAKVKPIQESEKDFQATIIQLAQLCGWMIAHFRPAMTSKGWRTPVQGDIGFPDLVLVSPPCKSGPRLGKRIVAFIEVKSDRGKLTAEQKKWLDALHDVDWAMAGVWKPGDTAEVEDFLAQNETELPHNTEKV